MSLVDDFLRKVPLNELPDTKKFIMALYDVLEILEEKGHLRPHLREHAERTKFVEIMKTSNRLFSAHNMLFNIFSEKGKSTKFVLHNQEFGLNEVDTAYLFLSESISMFIRSAELFKNCFLFILKEKRRRSKTGFWSRMTLGDLISRLDSETGGKSEPVTQELDNKLRNSLTHCLFWLEGSVLIYYEDLALEEKKEIIVSELWIKGRKHSLIAQCAINLIADWYFGT